LNDLEAEGLVTRVKIEQGPGKFSRNDYQLHEHRLMELTAAAGEESTHGKEGRPREEYSHGPGEESTHGPGEESSHIEHQYKNTIENTTNPPSPLREKGEGGGRDEALQAEFDEWWNHYPRKTAKQAARKAYRAARRTAPAVALFEGLARSIRSWEVEGRDKTKVPYPATWLNQGRWEDEETTAADVRPTGPARPVSALERLQARTQGAGFGSMRPVDELEAPARGELPPTNDWSA